MIAIPLSQTTPLFSALSRFWANLLLQVVKATHKWTPHAELPPSFHNGSSQEDGALSITSPHFNQSTKRQSILPNHKNNYFVSGRRMILHLLLPHAGKAVLTTAIRGRMCSATLAWRLRAQLCLAPLRENGSSVMLSPSFLITCIVIIIAAVVVKEP